MKTKLYVFIMVCCAGVLMAGSVWGQSLPFTLDFESGDLRGWHKTGTAFDFQPTRGDNPTARHRGQPSKHQGRYWIGTYEKYQGRSGQKPGAIQGDGPQGILTSASFVVPTGTLSFLVGGGNHFQTRVELLVGGQRVLHATGRNNETMRRVTWNISPHAGKTGQLRLVDAASGGWGHINADDFNFSHASTLGPVTANLTGQWRCNDGGTYYLRQLGNKVWWFGRSKDNGASWTNVFHGTIHGQRIVGQWADVPHGKARSSGRMTLHIQSPGSLRSIHKTGGFGGSAWTR